MTFLLCAIVAISSAIYASPSASAAEGETVTYLDGSDLLYDLMENATTFAVAFHKPLGGSHYAYTEALYEESTGEAATDVGTEYNFFPGSKLSLITLSSEEDKVKVTEREMLYSSSGCIRDPDVSPDGKRIVFSWKKQNSDDFHIYEMTIDNGNYRQLTFGSGTADTECIYLPSGEILFSSTRAVQTVDCWITPVSNIYKMSADGENIVRLGYDQVHTTYPTLTDDGRVIYTRWDYNDRTQMFIQGLFQMNPDGTNQTELYGNNSNFPTTLMHSRKVCGTSSLYLSIATGHHTYQAGKVCYIDVSKGRDSKSAITFPFPDSYTTTANNVDDYGQKGAIYQYPYPINESQFLVSYSADGWHSQKERTPFGIYLMDANTKEQIELIKGSSSLPAAQIVPVKTRETFLRPSMVDYAKNTGTYYIGDVYEGASMSGVARGTVKQIRAVALDYRPYAVGKTRNDGTKSVNKASAYTPIATGNGAWDVKQVLGVATVYEDGSAMFSVPSETPVYFQLLDENGNMVQTMRSWSTLMPGEIYSCVGCHEDNNTVPPAAAVVSMAAKAGVETLRPDVWQTEKGYDPYTTKEGFSYLEEVQPILDAKCISCHNNKTLAYTAIDAAAMPDSGITSNSNGRIDVIFPRESVWKYKTSYSNDVETGWNDVGFDDSSWSSGKAGFGQTSLGVPIGTPWSGDQNWIFVRKTFTIDDISEYENATIRLHTWYDDTPVYYLNGVKIFDDGERWTTELTYINLGKEYTKLLKEGENVLAISIHQHTGGRYIDSSFELIVPDENDKTYSNPISLEGDNIGASETSKYFPLSYLVLTESFQAVTGQWQGKPDNSYINWISTMSDAPILKAYAYGAAVSPMMKMLRNGHSGVKLTETELRTIAAWIDLCVPCYGEYDTNNRWDAAELREATEEQAKRNYYDMQNRYARLALAGTLPKGSLEITYKSGTNTYVCEGEGIVNLYLPQKIKSGDTVTVKLPSGVKYVGFTLTPKMEEQIVYCEDGIFTYTVPSTSGMVTTISRAYANTSGYVTARILMPGEVK